MAQVQSEGCFFPQISACSKQKSLLLFVFILNIASATTISEEQFKAEAEKSKLKPKKTSFVDLMGNEIKSTEVKHSSGMILGISRYAITCDSTLENSNLSIAVGVSFIDPKQKDNTEPIPCTLVINNDGQRVDIPIEKYIFDSGRSALFGAWSEYRFNLPISELTKAGITKIDAMSVIMKNPQTNTEVSYEPILKKDETKRVTKFNTIYNFYLNLKNKYTK